MHRIEHRRVSLLANHLIANGIFLHQRRFYVPISRIRFRNRAANLYFGSCKPSSRLFLKYIFEVGQVTFDILLLRNPVFIFSCEHSGKHVLSINKRFMMCLLDSQLRWISCAEWIVLMAALTECNTVGSLLIAMECDQLLRYNSWGPENLALFLAKFAIFSLNFALFIENFV